MKTLKALTLFFFFCSCIFTAYSQEYSNSTEIRLENQIKKTKDETENLNDEGVPIRRSIQLQPAYAYLYNNVISVNFSATFSIVTIRITNEVTGETVYSETSSNPASLNIDLNGESSGNYLIEIEADDTYLEGSFSL